MWGVWVLVCPAVWELDPESGGAEGWGPWSHRPGRTERVVFKVVAGGLCDSD